MSALFGPLIPDENPDDTTTDNHLVTMNSGFDAFGNPYCDEAWFSNAGNSEVQIAVVQGTHNAWKTFLEGYRYTQVSGGLPGEVQATGIASYGHGGEALVLVPMQHGFIFMNTNLGRLVLSQAQATAALRIVVATEAAYPPSGLSLGDCWYANC